MALINLPGPSIRTPTIATPSIRLPGGYTPTQISGPVIPQMYPTASKGYAPLPNTVQIPSYKPGIKLPPVVDFSKLTPGWGPGAMPAPQFAQPPVLTGMMSLINNWNSTPIATAMPKTVLPPAINIPVQTAKPAAPKLPAPAVKPQAITKKTK